MAMRYPKILPASFFERPVLEVAPELLGKYLVRKNGSETRAFKIVEVEAYDGEADQACHARRGRTPRTEALYGKPGHFYVYFCYGVHWMLNIVSAKEGYPAGVLIRGLEGVPGPGRVTKTLAIDKSLYGKPAAPESGLWVEDRGGEVPPEMIAQTPRIGVAYAGEWAHKPYRFVLSGAA